MKRYKIAQEDENSFLIDHGDGAPFMVAKKLLKPHEHEHIRHMAEGGKATKEPERQKTVEELEAELPSVEGEPPPALPGGPGPTEEVVGGVKRERPMIPEPGLPPAAPAEMEPPAATAAIPTAPLQNAAMFPGTPGAGGGRELRDLQAGEKEARAGMQAQADVAQQQAEQETIQRHALGEQIDAFNKSFDDQDLAWQKEVEAKEKAIHPIDPNQHWRNLGLPRQIGSALSMILGGIGSGLTGQPNAALAVIQNAIERDIEAQVTNLHKEENGVRIAMQKGLNMRQAKMLEGARLWQKTQFMLDGIAAQYKGPAAQAAAQTASGEFGMQAAQARAKVKGEMLDQHLKGLQITGTEMQLGLTRQIMAEVAGMGAPGGGGFNADRIALLSMAGDPAKLGKQSVSVPIEENGGITPGGQPITRVRFAGGIAREGLEKEYAQKVGPASESLRIIRDMQELRDRYGATLKGHPQEHAKMENLATQLGITWTKSAEDLARLNPAESEAATKMIADPAGVVANITGAAGARLNTMANLLQRHIGTLNSTHLLMDPSRPRR